MARRQASVSDSLDLLLDTICNMFGGILFIALLVVILLQLHGDEMTAAASKPVTPQELERLQSDLAARHADLHRLRELLDGQQQTLASLAPDELAGLVNEQKSAATVHAELTQDREQLVREIAELTGAILRTEAALLTADADLKAAEEQVVELERQLEDDRRSRRHELRTPVQRPSSLAEVGCVIQYGRFYVWHRYDTYGSRRGLNTDEFVVLEASIGSAHTAPRPTAGIVLDGSPHARQALMQRMSEFQPNSVHVAVIVRPDSFGEWRHARDVLVELGFEYRLMPTDTEIVDRGAEDSRVQ